MIIPIRCFGCNKILANKWKAYQKWLQEENENENENENETVLDKSFDQKMRGKFLESLGINKMCCKRHMLTHVDIIDTF